MSNLSLREMNQFSPWSSLGSWAKEFDQVFNEMDSLMTPLRNRSRENAAFPMAFDIQETDANYLIAIDLPGMSKEAISIEAVGNQLSISAERKKEHVAKGTKERRVERYFGSISRTFSLPDGIEPEKIQADYDNGVLSLTIPKGEVTRSRKIEIGSAKKH